MNLRTEMPATAAFIDALRAEFGKEGIDASIRKGMQGIPGYFHARENGRNVGTPAAPVAPEKIISADRMVIIKENEMETKCSACGQVSKNQSAGNGCHSCQRGIMVPTGK